MKKHPLNFHRITAEQSIEEARAFYQDLAKRRSVREFSSDLIPDGVIESCLLAAGTAPNGANLQPWHFAVITSQSKKQEIRLAAEAEEREFYESRAPQGWLDTLAPLGTDAHKPFLEEAPALIAIFQKSRTVDSNGKATKTYYPKESVGIATGMLITALHRSGLATLTHTPSPMNFLNQALDRPSEEKPFLLLVVGYPAANCEVPEITKLPLERISSWH